MKKSITKSLLLTTLLTSSVVWGGAPAFAEESLNEYSIDEIVVTATRTEKRFYNKCWGLDLKQD